MAHRVSFLFILLAVPSLCFGGGDLEIATGEVEITGPIGYPMAGYSARRGVCKGVHDPLMAKVLLLKSGDTQLALITYDLIAFPSEKVARMAREELGIAHVLHVASHTHSGPRPKSRDSLLGDPYFEEIEQKVLSLLRETQSRLVPARMAATETSALLAHNRRKINDDGTVTMFWRNEEKIPTAPVDPTVGIVRFTSEAGEPLAILVHFACHPVVMGPDNLDYSADYPGFMYRYVEEQLGGDTLCYYLPGASGDINPYFDKQPVGENGFGVAQDMGEKLGEAVIQALKRLPATAYLEPKLQISERLYNFKTRFPGDDGVTEEMPVQVTHALLADQVALVGIPGEVFVSHQIDLRSRSPLRHTFLVGYAHSGKGQFAGYVPTIQAAMEGGYGASYRTRIEVGAGEMIVDQAVIWIQQQLGRLRQVPDMGSY
jgi:hypothetical protein